MFTWFFILLDVDECSRLDACGHGATCSNNEGSYTCNCPEGTIPDPDPYIKCVGVVTCDIDDDCPGNSICDPQKRCLCPEPNVGNDCRRMFYYLYFLYYFIQKYLVFILFFIFYQILVKTYLADQTHIACC